jgi:hypothetical protein
MWGRALEIWSLELLADLAMEWASWEGVIWSGDWGAPSVGLVEEWVDCLVVLQALERGARKKINIHVIHRYQRTFRSGITSCIT